MCVFAVCPPVTLLGLRSILGKLTWMCAVDFSCIQLFHAAYTNTEFVCRTCAHEVVQLCIAAHTHTEKV